MAVYGRWLGPTLALLLLLLDPPEAFTPASWTVAALTVWMAVWWVSEAVPMPVTALLPLVFLPVLGVRDLADVAAPYAHPLIFLFLGGFLLALAVQRWNLHLRIALLVLGIAGQRPKRIVAGFMLATAGLSMWVSNTATAAMMLPIGISVLLLMAGQSPDQPPEDEHRFSAALLLGIAFAANIGGMGTLIGTPPNALLAAFLADNYDIFIGFGQWMVIGVPVALILLGGCWWILTCWAFPLPDLPVTGVEALLAQKKEELGPLTSAEKRVLAVFTLTALAWLLRPWLEPLVPGSRLSDPGIAITAAVALFLIPAGRGAVHPGALLDWDATRNLPWGVLLLVGGGLSLGTALEQSGLAGIVAAWLAQLAGLPILAVITTVALLTMLLSHVTSNTAAAATLLPVASSLALALGVPVVMLAVPVALAASCAFMLPVATPPNAIIFSSERLRVVDMVQAGARVSVLAMAIIIIAVLVIAQPLLG